MTSATFTPAEPDPTWTARRDAAERRVPPTPDETDEAPIPDALAATYRRRRRERRACEGVARAFSGGSAGVSLAFGGDV